MANLRTTKFRINVAEQFKEAFDESDPTRLYLFIGRSYPWANDASPTNPTETVETVDYDPWRDILAAKIVRAGDVSLVIPRLNWANNTLYDDYRSNSSTMYANNYYVMTDESNVYKCLFNNGANSVVKPTGTSTSKITTSDGYTWKFMYTVTSADALKFLTSDFIPVKRITSDDSSAQWAVQQAATNGSIDIIDVVSTGSGYTTYTTGTFSAVSNSSILNLANTASGTDDLYVGSTVFVDSGAGSGQLREIINYVGSTKRITVNTGFSTTPNTTSTYIVSPKINITGDGTGATAYCNVTSGAINKVTMVSTGRNYGWVDASVSSNTGSGGVVKAYVSPPGGHGSNPVDELAAHNVMINVRVNGTEGNTFFTGNDFRVVGLMKNPLLANGSIATASAYNQTTRLNISDKTGAFTLDEFVTGGTTGAKARVVYFANTNGSGTAGNLYLTHANGTFSTEVVTGNTSSVTATVSSVTEGSLKLYSGDMLYIDNRLPVTRSVDQTEDIKILSRF
jgi:hypothetical protein